MQLLLRWLICIVSLTSLFLLQPRTPVLAAQTAIKSTYALALNFDLDKHQITGTAHITIAAGEDFLLFLNDITVTGIVLHRQMLTPQTVHFKDETKINIPAAKVQQELYISYRKTITDDGENYLNNDGITLLTHFYPQPVEEVLFSVSANLPSGFTAISESDTLNNQKKGHVHFSFSRPIRNIHFIAAPFVVNTVSIREGLSVSTYLFSEDQHLSEGYLQAAEGYLRYYEERIGKYPYQHFAIVENRLPSGYAMPTFTLLGQSVIRLPFIRYTSLGHEILHSWFGSAVQVEDQSGNWCEGLTSYLADWSFREIQQQGAIDRKEHILQYSSYIEDANDIPLSTFQSSSHSQPMARTLRSIGYIKGAMLFHELKKRIGDKDFGKAISMFYDQFNGKKASWSDIQTVFSEVTQSDLTRFFRERLERHDIPSIDVNDLQISSTHNGTALNFTLIQKTHSPYDLMVPLQVVTAVGTEKFTRRVISERQEVTLPLKAAPQKLVIDPDYDLIRQLVFSERVPTWSQFMGPASATVIIDERDMDVYSEFLDAFAKPSWTIKNLQEITNSSLAEDTLIFLGTDNAVYQSLFAASNYPEKGFVLEARHNPLNNEKYVLTISASSKNEVMTALSKLSHYGKYSYLHFVNGVIDEKKIKETDMGQIYLIETPPFGIPRKSLYSFAEILNEIKQSRVIYIGEEHTSLTDHHLQLLVIEKLFHENPNIAIGLEMFPTSSQEALDLYIFSDEEMNEKQFLKKSQYFQVWSYDYRYYRNIINYARMNRIPVIGLNIDRSIVGNVYQEGSTDALSPDQMALLPTDRNLAMPGYTERLAAIHDIHMKGSHGQGGLGGFIQAQGIWDEVMAKNISDYLRNNPQKQMVVLAGAQHTRDDSGIPPRVKRRINLPQHTLLSATNFQNSSKPLADIYISSSEKILAPAGKIGVTLEETQRDDRSFLRITALSPHGNAKDAGLLENDILLTINGFKTETLEDVRIAMVDAKPKDIVSLEIERKDGDHRSILHLSVELYTLRPDV